MKRQSWKKYVHTRIYVNLYKCPQIYIDEIPQKRQLYLSALLYQTDMSWPQLILTFQNYLKFAETLVIMSRHCLYLSFVVKCLFSLLFWALRINGAVRLARLGFFWLVFRWNFTEQRSVYYSRVKCKLMYIVVQNTAEWRCQLLQPELLQSIIIAWHKKTNKNSLFYEHSISTSHTNKQTNKQKRNY